MSTLGSGLIHSIVVVFCCHVKTNSVGKGQSNIACNISNLVLMSLPTALGVSYRYETRNSQLSDEKCNLSAQAIE